jgi:transcriptional regulator with XRE-family HTH domain
MNGKQLRYIRKALNMSQTEIAEKLDLTFLTIWRYEAGKQNALPKTLRHMQYVLNYTEEDLLDISELLEDENASSRQHARLKMKLRQQANI